MLRRLHHKLGTTGLPTLRNPEGVYMKLMNLKAHDPESVSLGRRGLPTPSAAEIDAVNAKLRELANRSSANRMRRSLANWGKDAQSAPAENAKAESDRETR